MVWHKENSLEQMQYVYEQSHEKDKEKDWYSTFWKKLDAYKKIMTPHWFERKYLWKGKYCFISLKDEHCKDFDCHTSYWLYYQTKT